MSQIVVVGCGAIGAPIAVAFAAKGQAVLGVERDGERALRLAEGRLEEDADGLNAELSVAAGRGLLSFATHLTMADQARAFIVAVPTPIDASERYDGSILETAIGEVLAVARQGDLIAIRSTMPIGSLRRFAKDAAAAGRHMLWAVCPTARSPARAWPISSQPRMWSAA